MSRRGQEKVLFINGGTKFVGKNLNEKSREKEFFSRLEIGLTTKNQ
jgi:hypothetical protein